MPTPRAVQARSTATPRGPRSRSLGPAGAPDRARDVPWWLGAVVALTGLVTGLVAGLVARDDRPSRRELERHMGES